MLKIKKHNIFLRAISLIIVVCFSATMILPQQAYAQAITPASNLVSLSAPFTPTLVRGIRVYPDNPLKFDFIVDSGDTGLKGDALKQESEKLIRYFLASLTLPEDELWVNLSPYEKDRIVPDALGSTEMGRDMLSQDYLLKQITASLTNPDSDLGKDFWSKVYQQAYAQYGTTNIPVDTFNKVWIMPEKATVYVQEDKAFIVDSKLKVMLEEDYLAAQESQKAKFKSQNENQPLNTNDQILTTNSSKNKLASRVVREVFIPALEKEVNTGKNFAQLRQIYNAIILGYWYKTNLKNSILNKVYTNQHKVKGIDLSSKDTTDKIYAQYLDTFKKGICNMMKVEYDPYAKKSIPRKYFAGGVRAFGNDIKPVIVNGNTPQGQRSASAIVSSFKRATAAIMLIGVMLTVSLNGSAQTVQKVNNPASNDQEQVGLAQDRSGKYSFYKGKIQSDPPIAFREFSLYKGEPWAQEILKTAAEKIVKDNPIVVVLFSSSYEDPSWASKILKEAVEEIINGETPFRVVMYFSKYKKYDWALEALRQGVEKAAKKTPESFVLDFYEIEKYDWALGYTKEALNNLLSEDPEKIFNAAFMFEGQSWFSEILKKAVEAVEKKDPQAVLNFFEGYQKEVWAKDVVERIAQKSPQIALMYADRYQGMPWAAEIIWSSAKRDPWSAYAYEKNFSSIYAQDSAAGRELKEEMDRLKERIRLTIKEMASDTSRDSGIYQRALGIYKNAKEDPSFKYWELKRSVANQFSKVDPIGLVGFLNTAYVGDLLAVSQITGIDPEFIMAVYAQEGAALLHRWKEYNSKEIVDAYDGVGMDNVYALLPALLKNGLPVEYEKILNYRKNESGMILRSVSIKEKEALKAIAGVLQILQNQLKNDVTEKWGPGAWNSMTRQVKNFWIYVYYNAGIGMGREILYAKKPNSLRNGWIDYKKVYENAARTAGGAELLRLLKLFEKMFSESSQGSLKTEKFSAIDPLFDSLGVLPVGNELAAENLGPNDSLAWIGIGDTAYVIPSSSSSVSSSVVQVQRLKEQTLTDVQQILDLDRSFFPRNYQMKREHVESYLSDPNTRVLVAKEDSKIVGFSIYYTRQVYDSQSAYFHLARIVTSRDKRGEGIGTQLMDQMVEDIKSQGKNEFSYVPFNGASFTWFQKYSVQKGFTNKTIGSLGEKIVLSQNNERSSSVLNKANGEEALGGIDFNSQSMNVETKGQAIDFVLPNGVSAESLMNAQGFMPTIINMTPVTDFMGLLGLLPEQNIDKSSLSKEDFNIKQELVALHD